jgi:hypothetical protein
MTGLGRHYDREGGWGTNPIIAGKLGLAPGILGPVGSAFEDVGEGFLAVFELGGFGAHAVEQGDEEVGEGDESAVSADRAQNSIVTDMPKPIFVATAIAGAKVHNKKVSSGKVFGVLLESSPGVMVHSHRSFNQDRHRTVG